jgi:hypothetical protein
MEHERPIILAEAHDRIVGGNYARKDTTHKVLHASLRVGKPSRRDEIPLRPQVTLKVFDK